MAGIVLHIPRQITGILHGNVPQSPSVKAAEILQARYFDVYCTSNEEAYLNLGISSSTYYRHIKPAIRAYAASLWCVVIPDLIIREHLQQSGSVTAQVEVS